MKITFNITYHTKVGQQVAVTGASPELGQDNLAQAFRLRYVANGRWSNTIELPDDLQKLEYKYVLISDASELLDEEWEMRREVVLSEKTNTALFLNDAWRVKNHPNNPLYTTAFLDVIFKPGHFRARTFRPKKGEMKLAFQINEPRLASHEQICVLGNIPELGNWDLTQPLLLGNKQFPQWSGIVSLKTPLNQPLEYKYGIYNSDTQQVTYLEDGVNRIFNYPKESDAQEIIINDEYFRHYHQNWKGTGVAIPVFSLRSERGFGVGDFGDFPLLVDWAKQLGLKMVQILPINDTTATYSWIDSYPYAAISVFALHPLYLAMEQLKGFRKAVDQKEFRKEQKKLNALPVVDYERVMELKLKYARQIFDLQKNSLLKSVEFKQFLAESGYWLKPYALFCYFRDKFNTVNFKKWKTGSRFSKAILKKYTNPISAHFDDIAFYYFLQFYLNKQLKEAATYARNQQIILKGDIPIGIYRHSVDAWTNPELFNMDGQSGAPPDPFSEIGQNWGFPTYDWTQMAKDGYQWWQQRLQQMAHYFDAFRIDHILGFFRIWDIPITQVEGSFGIFNKAIPIKKEEFAVRGIDFDEERLCQPYIPEHLVYELFEADTTSVITTFLELKKPGFYQFLPQFDTQRKVEAWVEKKANSNQQGLKKSLFSLLSNVLFFKVMHNGEAVFHPRIEFLKIPSFLELDGDTRAKLKALYLDYFYHRQEDFWRQEALVKLPAIKKATNMLICGEDLGMVPACVPGVMKDMEILTLEIQRMSKNEQTEFLQEADIPYWSVCSPSTHDMSPIRLWWEEMEPEQKTRFYQKELKQSGLPPRELTPFLAQLILLQHLNFPSMWTVFPIQDILAMNGTLRYKNPRDERINVPANPQHYWRYRFHLSLEELIRQQAFAKTFRHMVEKAERD